MRDPGTSPVILIARHLAVLLLGALLAKGVAAERLSDTFNGRKALADFMVGLAKHVSWPDQAFASERSDFVVCVLGPDPFEGSLQAKFGNRQIGRRRLAVRQVSDPLVQPLNGCHQVFVGAGLRPKIKEILARFDNLSVLSVSDMEGFASMGGMVGVVGSGNRVSLQINRTALLASGLTISPALLRLGR